MNTDADSVAESLHQLLSRAGFKSKLIPIEHLKDLKASFDTLLNSEALDGAFYDEVTVRYGLRWHFDGPPEMATSKSILIVAAPQPKVRVCFTTAGKTFDSIIPPTYLHHLDALSSTLVTDHLRKHGYRVFPALLPEKLLIVQSGLGAYGKNNIAYCEGFGSFFRPTVYFTELPCDTDPWQDMRMLTRCRNCSACMKTCPTGAIQEDRFLIDAGRCLTYFNERSEPFPDWIESEWHNALIGCMKCQDICPLNCDHKDWITEGAVFSVEETRMILNDAPRNRLSAPMIEKLRELNLLDDYALLRRNLKLLIHSQRASIKNRRS